MGLLSCAEARRLPPPELPEIAALSRPLSYEQEVRPVVEGRCVVCHACYDAPCQLQYNSVAGAQRTEQIGELREPEALGTAVAEELRS